MEQRTSENALPIPTINTKTILSEFFIIKSFKAPFVQQTWLAERYRGVSNGFFRNLMNIPLNFTYVLFATLGALARDKRGTLY